MTQTPQRTTKGSALCTPNHSPIVTQPPHHAFHLPVLYHLNPLPFDPTHFPSQRCFAHCKHHSLFTHIVSLSASSFQYPHPKQIIPHMASSAAFAFRSLDGAAEAFKIDQDYKRDADHRHKWALGTWEVDTYPKHRHQWGLDTGETDTYPKHTRTVPVTPLTSK